MKIYRNYIVIIYIMLFFALFLSCDSETDPTGTGGNPAAGDSTMIIDHTSCDLSQIPQQAIEDAKSNLIIAYGHTSHGSQLVEGMKGLIDFADSLYSFNGDGSGGALQLRDYAFGTPDLGNPDRISWEASTRTYLDAHAEVNVVIWSWCGQVSSADEGEIDLYLSLMNGLESEIRSKIIDTTAHITVFSFKPEDLSNWRALIDEIEDFPDVLGASPFIQSKGAIAGPKSSDGVLIRGIDPNRQLLF